MGARYLTGKGADGLEVQSCAVLQLESDWASGIGPGDGEGLTGCDLEVGVCEADFGIDADESRGCEKESGELHFRCLCLCWKDCGMWCL